MTFLEFAQEVAAGLSELTDQRWSATDPHGYGNSYIIADGGNEISIKHDGYNWINSKRVEIYGVYPRYKNHRMSSGREAFPKITCAISRGGEAVAKDIVRRFLDDYKALVEKARVRIEETHRHNEATLQCAEAVAKAFGEELHKDGERDLYVRPGLRLSQKDENGLSFWGSVDISAPDSVKIELRSLPCELAAEIGEVIKRYKKK